ncbi:hypothetical protein POM88_038391 [Heracleum sosnowskyi]|uniref:Uncharacterized protein n=1 Tax=Heracleum sosnowskyi TaxID=360622 RepID=A0AAD8HB49_9APIA|nr:hypothetical protein POM88_038391 [Heracleum sosnowskyi]
MTNYGTIPPPPSSSSTSGKQSNTSPAQNTTSKKASQLLAPGKSSQSQSLSPHLSTTHLLVSKQTSLTSVQTRHHRSTHPLLQSPLAPDLSHRSRRTHRPLALLLLPK